MEEEIATEICIPISEAKEIFELLERVNHLFHQPTNFDDGDMLRAFSADNYPMIKKLYYKTVWGCLPEKEQRYYLDRRGFTHL